MVRKTLITAALGALCLSSTACNTVKGIGEDIKSVGETGEEVIND
ncbi:MAG: Entericidin EcnA/B family protein [Pseudomonadota bacterium]